MTVTPTPLICVPGFVTPSECATLIGLIEASRQPSTTTTGEPGFRTSDTCNLADQDSPLVPVLDQRIAALLRQPLELGEPIQGQHYAEGQEFKAHRDYFTADALKKHSTPAWGQRTWTCMVYLNVPQVGGGTHFPQLGVRITPTLGTAIAWSNLLANGAVNPATLHHGEPVIRGRKVIITKWFRQQREA